MGYRSNIVIAINKKILARDLISPCIPTVLKNEEHQDIEGNRYWVLEQWRWYPDYPKIKQIEDFFGELSDEEFGAVRVGKNDGDVQSWGDPYAFDIEVRTSIHSPAANV